MANKFEFNPKTGCLSAVSYVQATCEYQCKCGNKFDITLQWPEGLTSIGEVQINDVVCPKCSNPVVLPYGRHYLEGFRLMTDFLQ